MAKMKRVRRVRHTRPRRRLGEYESDRAITAAANRVIARATEGDCDLALNNLLEVADLERYYDNPGTDAASRAEDVFRQHCLCAPKGRR
jgi:hypothetical protein